MKAGLAYVRFKIGVATAFAALTFLSGCAGPGREILWSEVVETSTGEKFVVKRKEIRRLVAEPFQEAGWLFQEAIIEAELPGVGLLYWETSLRPWLLDRAKDGRWYLIARRGSYASEYEYGLFDGRQMGPRFVFYRHRPGDWERILADDLPPEFVSPNLLIYGESIFEPHMHSPYWGRNSQRAESPFRNGDLLELELKRKVNVPSHDLSSKALFDISLTRVKFSWMLDHGQRQLSECVTGEPCNDECWRRGGTCRSVRRFDVGQTLGRPPKSLPLGQSK